MDSDRLIVENALLKYIRKNRLDIEPQLEEKIIADLVAYLKYSEDGDPYISLALDLNTAISFLLFNEQKEEVQLRKKEEPKSELVSQEVVKTTVNSEIPKTSEKNFCYFCFSEHLTKGTESYTCLTCNKNFSNPYRVSLSQLANAHLPILETYKSIMKVLHSKLTGDHIKTEGFKQALFDILMYLDSSPEELEAIPATRDFIEKLMSDYFNLNQKDE